MQDVYGGSIPTKDALASFSWITNKNSTCQGAVFVRDPTGNELEPDCKTGVFEGVLKQLFCAETKSRFVSLSSANRNRILITITIGKVVIKEKFFQYAPI